MLSLSRYSVLHSDTSKEGAVLLVDWFNRRSRESSCRHDKLLILSEALMERLNRRGSFPRISLAKRGCITRKCDWDRTG